MIKPVTAHTNYINGVLKITKPFNPSVTGGQFDPRVLADLTRFKQPVGLTSDRISHDIGNVNSTVTDPVGDLVTVRTTQLTASHRSVNVDWLTPQTVNHPQLLVYFHGGAFYGGTPANTLVLLKLIAARSHCEVINVHYGLAPKHPAPEGILDGLTVVQALAQQRPKAKITIAGDSAGANIAIAAATLNRQFGSHNIFQQLLLYPVTAPHASHLGPLWDLQQYPIVSSQQSILAHYHLLFKQLDSQLTAAYLPPQMQVTDPLIAPLYQQNLAQTPPTTIMMGEFDPFRLQAWAYARRLAAAEVATTFVQYQGQTHAFAPFIDHFWQARDVAELITEHLVSLSA